MSSVEQMLSVGTSTPLLSLQADARTTAELALGWADAALTVRAVRGRKTHTLSALFDEFSAALQFPYYFGENWSAFDECLSDLDWLSARVGFVVVIYDADQLLQEEHPEELAVFVQSIHNAAATFEKPVDDGEWWDRPAMPFHVVLQQAGNGDALAGWTSAGAHLRPVELT